MLFFRGIAHISVSQLVSVEFQLLTLMNTMVVGYACMPNQIKWKGQGRSGFSDEMTGMRDERQSDHKKAEICGLM